MNYKHSLSLFANNINLSFKALLYNLIVFASFSGIIVLVMSVNLSVIINSAEAKALVKALSDSFGTVLSGDYSFIGNVNEKFVALMDLIGNHLSSVFWSIGLGLFILYLESVAMGVGNYTLEKIVDAHMATISKPGFIETMISTLKKSIPFEALYSLIKIVMVFIVFAIGYLVGFLTIRFLSAFAFIISAWVMIFLVALFFALTVLYRPSIMNGLGIKAALKAKVSGKQFWANVAAYVLSITIAIVVNVLFFLTTFGAGIVISGALTGLFFACLQLVIYYNVNNRKFYIDIDNIVTPIGLREDKDLLDNVDVE